MRPAREPLNRAGSMRQAHAAILHAAVLFLQPAHRREVRSHLAKNHRKHVAAVALLGEVAKGVAHPPEQRFSGKTALRQRAASAPLAQQANAVCT